MLKIYSNRLQAGLYHDKLHVYIPKVWESYPFVPKRTKYYLMTIVLGFGGNVNCDQYKAKFYPQSTDTLCHQAQAYAWIGRLAGLAFRNLFQSFAIQNCNALTANINIAICLQIIQNLRCCLAIGANTLSQILMG